MEYIEGLTLREWKNNTGIISELQVINIANRSAPASNAAHMQDIIHRDLKPENIMIQQLE